MSERKRYCSHCGQELDNNVKYCNNCGTPVPNQQSKSVGYSDSRYTAKDEKKIHVRWKPLFIIAVVIVVFIIIYAGVSGTYKRPVKNFIKAIETYDAKEWLDCFPQFYTDLSYDPDSYTLAEYEIGVQEVLDEIEEEVEEFLYTIGASNFEFSIEGAEDCDEGEINSFAWDFIIPIFGIEFSDVPNIRAMKIVTVEITADSVDGKSDYSDDMLVCVGKIGLKWYVLNEVSDFW